jgi:hypothetical protein
MTVIALILNGGARQFWLAGRSLSDELLHEPEPVQVAEAPTTRRIGQ